MTRSEEKTIQAASEHYRKILELVGADISSEGIRETPRRAAQALFEMTEGSRMDREKVVKLFSAECEAADCHDMVIVEDIREVALCEHHLLPFPMSITIAYIPSGKILGLSKMARIAALFSRRLQNQERIAHQIADFMEQVVHPLGVAVFIEGKHTCLMARGVRDHTAVMKVDVVSGLFKNNPATRNELLLRLEKHNKSLL